PAPFYVITPRHSSIHVLSNDPAPTNIYTLSLHDALPISPRHVHVLKSALIRFSCPRAAGPPYARTMTWVRACLLLGVGRARSTRSEEHTSELQSRGHHVCRLLLEKKNCKWHDSHRDHGCT